MSREIDAQVAVEVVGVDNMDFLCPRCLGTHFGSTIGDDNEVIDRVCHGPPMSCGWRGPAIEACPAYSTDIGAAWSVVEKMEENGFFFHLDTGCHAGNVCTFFIAPNMDDICEGVADTAPMAICLAALEALRSELARQTQERWEAQHGTR